MPASFLPVSDDAGYGTAPQTLMFPTDRHSFKGVSCISSPDRYFSISSKEKNGFFILPV